MPKVKLPNWIKWNRKAPSDDPASSQAKVKETSVKSRSRMDFGRWVAVSCDEDTLSLAAARRSGTKSHLLAIERVDLPEQVANENERDNFVADKVLQFAVKHVGRNAQVMHVVQGRETTYRTFLMPAMKRRDLSEAVVFEARKQLPFPMENCVYGYRILSKLTGERPLLRLALHAATADHVRQQLGPYRQRGIAVSEVVHAPEVNGHLLGLLPEFQPEAGYTIVEMGRKNLQISFYRGTTLEFSFAGSGGSSMMGQIGLATSESLAQTIFDEVQTSQDFYAGQFGRGLSNYVYLVGDHPDLEQLAQMASELGGLKFGLFPVSILGSWGRRHRDGSAFWMSCLPTVAASLCQAPLVNLLPADRKQAIARRRNLRISQAAAAVILLGLAVGWGTQRIRVGILEQQLQETQERLEVLQESVPYRTYHAIKRQITSDQAYLDATRKSDSEFNLCLKELSRLAPANLRLTSLQFLPAEPQNNLTLNGLITTDDVPPELVLAEFVENLAASPFCDKVIILRHNKKPLDQGFEIQFSLGMTGVVS